ncbi:hypothetical protein ACFX1X_005665 [Malus domestica]
MENLNKVASMVEQFSLISSKPCKCPCQWDGLSGFKAQGEIGHRAESACIGAGPCAEINSYNIHVGSPSPSADNLDIDLDLDNLGQQLSILNLMSSQEQYDNPGDTSTVLMASVDFNTCWNY